VDRHALSAPSGAAKSVKTLARYLTDAQPDETHKARAIYAWVTHYIAYVDSTDEQEIWATPEHLVRQTPEKVLENRTAVCQGYANLFCALANEAGIPCEVVTGIVKNLDGKIETLGHAWAAARLAGEWRLFDPTWGVPAAGAAGGKVVDKYFMAPPEQFVLQHLPDDPVWQLLENPISEKKFRDASNEEVLGLVKNGGEGKFKFRDTLAIWLEMDSLGRLFSSEGRVLRFNGSNERVIFGLGQNYWSLLFGIRRDLDSLTKEAILFNRMNYDSSWFEGQLTLMERYHARARNLFDKLRTPERVEKAKRFYTPKDVAALLDRLRGDMRTGIFEVIAEAQKGEPPTEAAVGQLAYQFSRAREHYDKCEKNINCDKFDGECFNIKHNRSLMAIKLAEARLRALRKNVAQGVAPSQAKKLGAQIRLARENYLHCSDICRDVLQRNNHRYLFMKDRLDVAKQGLLDLRYQEIRIEMEMLTPELSEILGGKQVPVSQVEKLEVKLLNVSKQLEQHKDTLRRLSRELDKGFIEVSLFNVELEIFALRFNTANLRYLSTLWQYNEAYQKNEIARKREALRAGLAKSKAYLGGAEAAAKYLEKSGLLPESSAERKKQQVAKLKEAIKTLESRY
jgi:Uncharacterized protein involved in cytokinesis, contains TGc (transglutaminase/protease-like) domain